MKKYIDIAKETKGSRDKKTKESLDWYRDMTKNKQLFKKNDKPSIGEMFLFSYDAKTKDKLPFFDMNPLVFPIEFYQDGFLGINLHYLPPLGRAALMDSLKSLSTDRKFNEKTKLNISYKILKSYANSFRGFENCIKRYLYGHVRSSFLKVSSTDWDKAVLLPLQQWSINYGRPPY